MKPLYLLTSFVLCLNTSSMLYADATTSSVPNANLDPQRYGIKTITNKKDDSRAVTTLYKDLDQDGVEDRYDQCLNTGVGYAVDEYGCELDSDKDGVYDRFDQCPDTYINIPVNFLGCEADQDKDGVLDSADLCPNTPLGVKVDAQGCKAILDTDGDGVLDPKDQCPDTPLGSTVNNIGCVPEAFVITNIIFNSDAYYIRADQKAILDEDAGKLRKLAPNELLVITGYTDSLGNDYNNEKLSWNRAQSTKDYLVKTFNIPQEQIYVLGKGRADPVATNATREGRQKNRRITLEIKAIKDLPQGAQNNIPKVMQGYQGIDEPSE
ncbi:OmpA family protein [Thiosulfativibrio zosterae]|uniref:OmpA-like domain-containing protein n=1 Tax=Thiosulfativibrio zosterae TaxID=2675053 RepID=A0A6F8PQE2_9GAMM|nr:OmpA family protein [Thiosulfativibrio zosterae]BBP44247.1 hypothetical protein THMIRHAT_19930 [Thiosulfativibrio zosterae]